MARNYISIIEDMFSAVKGMDDLDELKYNVKLFAKAIKEANNEQSVRVYGVNKHSPSGFIKMQLRSREMPPIGYFPNPNRKKI